MSTTGGLSSQNDTPEERLTRYLFVGKEYPVYHPGNWFFHDYYTPNNLPSIQEFAQNTENPSLPIEIIKKVLEHADYVQNPETLIFALAMCASQTENEKLRAAAYSNVSLICKSSQHFILFVKFCKQIHVSKQEKNGYGHGWRKSVTQWYNSKSPMELAKCVTQCKGRYGYKHKDIIKLAHYHPPESPEINFIVKYIMNGFSKAKEAVSLAGDSDVLTYIENVERFKHCEDEFEAGRLIEMYNLNLDYVPAHLLKSEEVWSSLTQTMNLTTLLENLQRIHNLGFLKSENPILTKVMEALTCKDKIIENKIQPALVFITIRNHENSGKPMPSEKRIAQRHAKKQPLLHNNPNTDLIACLYKTLDLSSENLKPTGLRYVIAVNMNKQAMDNQVWHNSNIKVYEALAILTYSFRYEENLIFVTYKSWGGHTESINKSQSFGEIMQKMEKLPVGNVSCDKPMNWASAQNKEVDVFINIVDQANTKLTKAEEGIKFYRKKMNLPNAKLVNCAMCAWSTYLKDKYDKNVLNICGFDANVPKIIQAFAKSLF